MDRRGRPAFETKRRLIFAGPTKQSFISDLLQKDNPQTGPGCYEAAPPLEHAAGLKKGYIFEAAPAKTPRRTSLNRIKNRIMRELRKGEASADQRRGPGQYDWVSAGGLSIEATMASRVWSTKGGRAFQLPIFHPALFQRETPGPGSYAPDAAAPEDELRECLPHGVFRSNTLRFPGTAPTRELAYKNKFNLFDDKKYSLPKKSFHKNSPDLWNP